MKGSGITAVLLGALTLGAAVGNLHAAPQSTNTGSVGFLVLPLPETLAPGDFTFHSELGLDYRNEKVFVGPGPLAIAFGMPPIFEMSFSLRDRGLTRDLRRDFGNLRAGLKIALLKQNNLWPGVALEAYGDHLMNTPVVGGRVLYSQKVAFVQLGLAAGFHSGRARAGAGPDFSVGLSYELTETLTLIGDISAEGKRPWGVLGALGARYHVLSFVAVTVAAYGGFVGRAPPRLVVSFNLFSSVDGKRPEPERPAQENGQAVKPRVFKSETPRFLLRLPLIDMPGSEGDKTP